MANSEATFRQELRRDAKEEGVRTVGNSPEFNIGIPDLYTKHEDCPGTWVELKWLKVGNVVALTPPQRAWIADEQRHGGSAGWAVCKMTGPREWTVYVGTDPEAKKINEAVYTQVRKTGEKWHVFAMVCAIYQNCFNAR